MVWLNYHKSLTKNNDLQLHDAVNLHDTLKSSYGDKRYQNKILAKGYIKDNQLSNHNEQVYYRPHDKKLLYNVAGTHNLNDWVTDAALLFGNLKNTSRYKEADKTLKQAKVKYNPNETTLTAHSLGSTIINNIASKGNNDKVFALDGGFTFGQKISNNPNFHNYRTDGDLVSVLSKSLSPMKTLENKNLIKDPIRSHDISNIKQEKIYV
jgi:hypothetical protein